MKQLQSIKSEDLEFDVGKSYSIDIPNSEIKHVNAHILNIIDDNKNIIIVFKYYSKYKRHWYYRAEELETLDIYNDKI